MKSKTMLLVSISCLFIFLILLLISFCSYVSDGLNNMTCMLKSRPDLNTQFNLVSLNQPELEEINDGRWNEYEMTVEEVDDMEEADKEEIFEEEYDEERA